MKHWRKSLSIMALASIIALPLAIPTEAAAASCKTRKLNGTLLGAAGGALVGDAVSRGSTGTIVGGLAGAVVGREVGRSGCSTKRYYRSASAPRPAYQRSSSSRDSAPARRSVRKVYYDQYGTPVAEEYR